MFIKNTTGWIWQRGIGVDPDLHFRTWLETKNCVEPARVVKNERPVVANERLS